MRHQDAKLRSLVTYDQIQGAIDGIERDWQNVVGGYNAWRSGRQTYLLLAAEKKIAKLNAKLDKICIKADFPQDCGCVKCDPTV